MRFFFFFLERSFYDFLIYFFLVFSLKDFHVNVKNNIEEWKIFYDLPNPHEATFPAPYENIDEMLKLIVLKCFRSDKIVPAIRVSTDFFLITFHFIQASSSVPFQFIPRFLTDPDS